MLACTNNPEGMTKLLHFGMGIDRLQDFQPAFLGLVIQPHKAAALLQNRQSSASDILELYHSPNGGSLNWYPQNIHLILGFSIINQHKPSICWDTPIWGVPPLPVAFWLDLGGQGINTAQGTATATAAASVIFPAIIRHVSRGHARRLPRRWRQNAQENHPGRHFWLVHCGAEHRV